MGQYSETACADAAASSFDVGLCQSHIVIKTLFFLVFYNHIPTPSRNTLRSVMNNQGATECLWFDVLATSEFTAGWILTCVGGSADILSTS